MKSSKLRNRSKVAGDTLPAVAECLQEFITAVSQLRQGQFQFRLSAAPPTLLAPLGQALSELGATLAQRHQQQERWHALAVNMNSGLLLEEVLEKLYRDFRDLIPYDRIGCALLEADTKTVRSHWVMADYLQIKLGKGYAAPLQGSSLETIINTGRPRILNDLAEYLKAHPDSAATKLIVAEGLRSSLTCPLIARSTPVGFLFFSSRQIGAYAHAHVDIYQRLAQQISVIVEKGRLASQLAAQKAAIEKQHEQLHQLNELRNKFLGLAVHDLRSPLATILLGAQTLLDAQIKLAAEDRRIFLQDILGQARQMLTLIEDILDVSQIEASSLSLRQEPLALDRLLSEAVHRHALLASPKGTRVLLAPMPAARVLADPIRLRQVLDNLISNAVKFSPPASTVRVRAAKNRAHWRVEVQDQGPGLTKQDRARLFQAFTRLSAQPTGNEKSVGLGLAITRHIVEAHGGQIGADALPGKGATFWFTLPA
jgi:signal transduction histidine kinase